MGGLTYGLVRWFLAVPLNQIEATASNVRKKCYVIIAVEAIREKADNLRKRFPQVEVHQCALR
jgi:hypothetical protein